MRDVQFGDRAYRAASTFFIPLMGVLMGPLIVG